MPTVVVFVALTLSAAPVFGQAGEIEFAEASSDIAENGGTAEFTVNRTGGSSGDVTGLSGGPTEFTDGVPEGVSEADWQEIRSEIEADMRRIRPCSEDGDTWYASHESTGIEAEFEGDGAVTVHGSESAAPIATVRLAEWGVPEAPRAAAEPAHVEVEDHRLAYHRPNLIEWYDNKPAGLMHGFTVPEPPSDKPEALRFTLAVDTEFDLHPTADNQGAKLRCPETGEVRYRYDGLVAWDANNESLTATIALVNDTVLVHVCTATATYPVTVDPTWVEEAKLIASDGDADDGFGNSVAIDGDTIVVGAPRHEVAGTNRQGAAYVFVDSGSGWSQDAKLTASDGEAWDTFGWSVAIAGDTIVVGAWRDLSGGSRLGAAYVYVDSGSGWTEEAKLTASDGVAGDNFGTSVSIDDDTIVVGARSHNLGGNNNQGAAYVYVDSGSGWTEEAKLTASDGAAIDSFGISVAIDGGTIVVGARGHDVGGNSSQGAAYVYVDSGSDWTQDAKLTASDGAEMDFFGNTVAIDGDTIVVGAYRHEVGGNSRQGAAYVYVDSGSGWTEDAKLTASDGEAGDWFGGWVAIAGDTIVSGAREHDVGGNNRQGAAYVYVDSGSGWTQDAKLTASDGNAEDRFGRVAVDGDTIVAGAPDHNVGGNSNQGAAYVYGWAPPTVTIDQSVSQLDPTNSSPIVFDVVFSEDVTGFTDSDVDLSASTVPGTLTASVSGSGATYTVEVSGMTDDGDVIATIPVGAVQSVDTGLDNEASTSTDNVVTYDITPPTVDLSTPVSDPTNQSPFDVTATFSEDVTGFEESDVNVGNGTTDNFSGSGDTYTFDVIPGSDGLVTVDVPAGIAEDAAGNGNDAATQLSRTYDGTPPTVSLSTPASDPTNQSPFEVTATFSENITAFEESDIDVGNGTTDNFSGSGDTYTFDVIPASDGLVTVDIPAGVAEDAAGNDNLAATQLSRTYDGTPPTVSLSTPVSDPTNQSPFTVTATFSEDVSGFQLSDINVGNGSAGNFDEVDAATYTFDVTPASDGQVTVDVPAGAAEDAAGNGNAAATQLSRTYDGTPPTVGLSTPVSDPTNASPFTVTVTFSEDVSGFQLSDVNVGNGSAGNFDEVDAATYTFDVTPASDGQVTVDVPAGAAEDAAGNDNVAATQLSRTYDGTPPTVSLSTPVSDPTNQSPFTVTAMFSEDVSGFQLSDVNVGNGSAGNFDEVDVATYTFDVTPASDGLVTVDVPAGAAEDAAGNDNVAATQLSRTYDVTPPTVSLSTPASDPTNASPFTVTATFSEDVSGFQLSDVNVGNGSAGNFDEVDAATYTFDVTPAADGLVTVDVPAGAAEDAAGNDNVAAPQLSRTYDGTPPTVSLSTPVSDPTNQSPFTVTATFSEDVSGFQLSDVNVGNGSAGNFDEVDAATYTFDVTPAGDGLVTVDVPAGSAEDAAGNGNVAATQLSRTYDGTPPTVSLSTPVSDPTNASPFTVTATFSEDVSGFQLSDVNVGNGGASNFDEVDAATYTFDVTPSSEGLVTVDVPAGSAEDAAGNGNDAATQLSRTFDVTPPTVTINRAATQASPTNQEPVLFDVVFDKDVTGFDETGVDLSSSTTPGTLVAVVNGSGSTYTVSVSGMTDDGTVIATVMAEAAQDAAGNDNVASTSTDNEVEYDVTPPTVTIDRAATQDSPTNQEPVEFDVVFDKAVTGFDETGVDLSSSTTPGTLVAVVNGSGTTYTVSVSGMTGDGTVIATVMAEAAQDAAGNDNVASTSNDNEVEYDITPPTATIEAATGQANPADVVPVEFLVTLSEPVVGLDSSAFELAASTAPGTSIVEILPDPTTNPQATSFDVRVTASDFGDITLALPAEAVQDAAGNDNLASTGDNTITFAAPVFVLRNADTDELYAHLGTHALSVPLVPATEATLRLRLENDGVAPLELLDSPPLAVSTTGPVVAWVASSPATPIAPSASSVAEITLVPQAEGAIELEITLPSNDPQVGTYTVTLTATVGAVPRAVLVEPFGRAVGDGEHVTLADHLIGGPSTVTFQLRNDGGAALSQVLVELDPTATSNATATLLTVPPSSLLPGDVHPIKLELEPSARGTFSFELHVESDDPTQPTITVPVSGYGAAKAQARIRVERLPGIAVGATDDLGVLPAAGQSETWTLRNVGTVATALQAVEVSDTVNVSATVTSELGEIAVGEALSLDVDFAPQSDGPLEAVLTLDFGSDATDPAPRTLAVAAEASAQPTPRLHLYAENDTQAISGEPVPVGRFAPPESRTLRYVLHNAGTETLAFAQQEPVVVADATNTQVTLETYPATELAPGATTELRLTLAPVSAATFDATIALATNDPQANPFELVLLGKEPAGRLELRRPALVHRAAGSTDEQLTLNRDRSYTLTYLAYNAGNAPLTLNPAGASEATRVDITTGASATLTTTPTTDTVLQPGEQQELQLRFTPRGSTYEIVLAVVSDDPNMPAYTLTIQGRAADSTGGCAQTNKQNKSNAALPLWLLLALALLLSCRRRVVA